MDKINFLKKFEFIKSPVFLTLAFCLFIRAIYAFPLDNVYLLGGSDFIAHFFRIWYIAKEGISNWNYYWYGGSPFLLYYPPLSYLIAGYIGKVIGALMAYKLVINFFFILAPLAFYLFLKEFKFTADIVIFSLLIFSFFPIYPYYFSKGSYATIINVFFILLFWKFLKRSINNQDYLSIILSTLFLFLSALTHHLTTFLTIMISGVWLVAYSSSGKLRSLLLFSGIILLTFLLSSYWYLPLFTEIIIPQFTISKANNIPTFFTSGIMLENVLEVNANLIVLFSFLIFLCAYSFFFIKDKNVQSFFATLFFILFLLVVLNYKRTFVFLPIPVAILSAVTLHKIKNLYKFFFLALLFLFLFINYFSVKKFIYEYPEIPYIPKEGRVIVFPIGNAFKEKIGENKHMYEALLMPMQGNEYILGWYPQSQSIKKTKFNRLIVNPFEVNYSSYLRDGWVNYILVNKKSKDLINIFENNKNFRKINETNTFLIFELQPKSTYIEINQSPINATINKYKDKIYINFHCKSGEMIIKESYHPKWKALLNGEEVAIEETDIGFIKTYIHKNEGKCLLTLQFKN